MTTRRRVFVEADFSAMESWLTAFHAQDEVMFAELRAHIDGTGPKPHVINAALVYDIPQDDVKTHMVTLQGRPQTAYYGGKRVSHLVNYGGEARKIADTLWVPIEFAERAKALLDEKYTATVQYRQDVVDVVFGRQSWLCTKCNSTFANSGTCPECKVKHTPLTRKLRLPAPKLVWNGYDIDPAWELYTAFGRRRMYRGRRVECANAIAAQRPQGDGASVWYRSLQRLAGRFSIDEYGNRTVWPGPPPEWQVRVATGTYDSFVVECWEEHAQAVLQWLLWTLEQPWPQLKGLRLPAEGSIGLNWGGYNEACFTCHKLKARCICGNYLPTNPTGLADQDTKPFTATCPSACVGVQERQALRA